MARHNRKRRIIKGSRRDKRKKTATKQFDISHSWEMRLLRSITETSQ